jgi:hypothetical protein
MNSWHFIAKQERVTKFQVKYLKQGKYLYRISSFKFITGEHWFAIAAGDANGCVHVYAYTSPAGEDKVKELEAHGDNAVLPPPLTCRSTCLIRKTCL